MPDATPSTAATTGGSRDRLVATAAELLLRHGYAATGLKAVSGASGVSIGSLYHHFPGGKADLAAEALRTAGALYEAIVTAVIDAEPHVADGIRSSFPSAAAMLEATDFADACPVATVALEVASSDEPLRLVTAEVFEGWTAALAVRLAAAGLADADARRLSLAYLAALEGGFVLCRATRSSDAMTAVGAAVADQVDAAFAELR
jgi:AcrR family transcriptional regulator